MLSFHGLPVVAYKLHHEIVSLNEEKTSTFVFVLQYTINLLLFG